MNAKISRAIMDVEQAILNAVADIEARREAEGKHPTHAMAIRDGLCGMVGLLPEGLRRVLNHMDKAWLVEVGDTVNDTYVRLVRAKKR